MSSNVWMKEDQRWNGRHARLRARWIAGIVAGGLSSAAGWACTERTETRVSPATAGSRGATAGESVVNAETPSSGVAERIGERTTRSQMLGHYGATTAMQRALIAGKLAEYQTAAAAVARDEWSPSPGGDPSGFTQRARAAATAAQGAPSLVAAAAALGALGDVCASCHLESRAPEVPIAPEEPSEATNPRMLAHAIASERLWAGLILPSDASWASGMRLLVQVPAVDQPSAEISAAVRLLNELARRGENVEPEGRGQIFGDVLLTCSGCHERLGVVPANGAGLR
jgi:hypothetical protein